MKKLSLNRETLRALDEDKGLEAMGGFVRTVPNSLACPAVSLLGCTLGCPSQLICHLPTSPCATWQSPL